MIYRISGGIFLILLALSMFGITIVPNPFIAIFGFVAGVALLIGV